MPYLLGTASGMYEELDPLQLLSHPLSNMYHDFHIRYKIRLKMDSMVLRTQKKYVRTTQVSNEMYPILIFNCEVGSRYVEVG